MSKEGLTRRDFIKTLGVVAGGALLSGCKPGFSKTKDTIERIINPNSTLTATAYPTLAPTPTGTTAPTETSIPTPTITPECKPTGLTGKAKEFLAGHEAGNGDTSRKVVLMTYDDMNFHENFTTILDAYKYFDVKTTFFLPGGYSRDGISLKNYATEITRIVSDGHVFGCHGLIHDPLTTYSSDQIRKDIEEWFKIVGRIIPGYKVKWFRSPYGDGDERTREVFAEYGLQSIMWSLESGGMNEGTYSHVIDNVSTGDIVLSHSQRYYDAIYAHSIIENLLSRGYSLESVETGLKPEDYLPSNLNPENCR